MAVMPVLSRNTVMSLAHRGTVPHRRLDCINSKKNYFVQLETLQLKTERCCSMQRTERTRVCIVIRLQSARPDFLRRGIHFTEYNGR